MKINILVFVLTGGMIALIGWGDCFHPTPHPLLPHKDHSNGYIPPPPPPRRLVMSVNIHCTCTLDCMQTCVKTSFTRGGLLVNVKNEVASP
jgi:hypothetical protein